MSKKILNILFLLIFNSLLSQNCLTQEVKIDYSNGLEVFNICKDNPKISYDNNLRYYWYTKYSKIKTTKGGSGGNLLSGEYKFFDENGNLKSSEQYQNGLLNGENKKWDKDGNLLEIERYKKGKSEYWKHREDAESFWVEHIGQMLTDGWIKNSYDKYNQRYANEITKGDNSNPQSLRTTVTRYYKANGTKEEVYTTRVGVKSLVGKYQKFHNNGKIETEGNFYSGAIYAGNVKDGTWKWYTENGDLEWTEEYKVQIDYWSNGNAKKLGSLYFDTTDNKWLKSGSWHYYDEDGVFQDRKEFELGIEKE